MYPNFLSWSAGCHRGLVPLMRYSGQGFQSSLSNSGVNRGTETIKWS